MLIKKNFDYSIKIVFKQNQNEEIQIIGKDFNDFLCYKVGINYKKNYERGR